MSLIYEILRKELSEKKVAILGFGREGKSTFSLFRNLFPALKLVVADRNPESLRSLETDPGVELISGDDYLEKLPETGILIKSPGIPMKSLEFLGDAVKISSQTDLFLQAYAAQIIGITGTKGKSTTSSLLFQVLKSWDENTIFVGNIGVPPFDMVNHINDETRIICEFSSHQLEIIRKSPHVAILLNIFQEHLDHYHSFVDYQQAKFNIARFQDIQDYFIYNTDNETIMSGLGQYTFPGLPVTMSMYGPGSSGVYIAMNHIVFQSSDSAEDLMDTDIPRLLPGRHNLYNIMAVLAVCRILKIPTEHVVAEISKFKPLEHRLEYVGRFGGIDFYNDSISTIPESTIEAIKSIEHINTLILGGYDRGIDYGHLAEFLAGTAIENILLLGEAGKRMEVLLKYHSYGKNIMHVNSFDELKPLICRFTRPGTVCLLSPAASSYDMFVNFEERGRRFKKMAEECSSPAIYE